MKILLVKLTSMGDTLHLLPAISDLKAHYPEVEIDWMIEDSFAEIPRWHPAVNRIIKVSTRRWRKLSRENISQFWQFVKTLRSERYDRVIDAQGLMKSAGLACFAKLNTHGQRMGFSSQSLKEKPAAKLYSKSFDVAREQHAVDRLRQLFAKAFAYPLPNTPPDYLIAGTVSTLQSTGSPRTEASPSSAPEDHRRTILLFHGTTWPSKHLPDQIWRELADLIVSDGYQVKVCWGNEVERKRAEWIVNGYDMAEVMPKSSLTELLGVLSSSAGAIAVDTGLGHLAAACGIPALSVYGSSDAVLTGAHGQGQILMQAQYPCSPCFLKQCDKLTSQVNTPPCYSTFNATDLWHRLREKII